MQDTISPMYFDEDPSFGIGDNFESFMNMPTNLALNMSSTSAKPYLVFVPQIVYSNSTTNKALLCNFPEISRSMSPTINETPVARHQSSLFKPFSNFSPLHLQESDFDEVPEQPKKKLKLFKNNTENLVNTIKHLESEPPAPIEKLFPSENLTTSLTEPK